MNAEANFSFSSFVFFSFFTHVSIIFCSSSSLTKYGVSKYDQGERNDPKPTSGKREWAWGGRWQVESTLSDCHQPFSCGGLFLVVEEVVEAVYSGGLFVQLDLFLVVS